MQNAPIGIFDSGLGGLTVAKAISNLLPEEELLYYGDTLHLPYGEKSPARIIEFSEAIVNYLISQDVKLIVIACNSASAIAASYLRKKYHTKIEIRGVIRPMLKAVGEKNFNKVGLIGTQATVNSGIYKLLLHDYNDRTTIESLATPLLVPMIEEGFNTNNVSKEVIREYLRQFQDIDALLLACTHYPLIKEAVINFFDNRIEVMDNADFMAHDINQYLKTHDLLRKHRTNKDQFMVSDYTKIFDKSASMFFGKQINVKEHNIFA